ncbi:LLM class flavin-dependent oxidoreductase [Roseibium polysiphoniae]|uniref:LLM class flavin-dependent oxidoreductase n=1 Tax=Roseibium polysiphoniae TaxID=2571221 RepID=A0ABR9C5V9_9HYPH|nr:LLM class flavin-dependent oxidoreductase [Roseibium polysiphoniae]MBD8874933.1 LLM class flavin-dependent oxidoreductase [Roseibium polysiphoniae]
MIPFSLLDLSPVPAGHSVREALANTKDLAQHAEQLGYKRYWMAEHHNMRGIASAATAVLIGHVAGATSTMRVGSGGIMLPNHAPLVIAEQFGTLAELYPDRIDLGLGRAPGTDMQTARALRRSMDNADNFPEDVLELLAYLDDPTDGTKILSVPGVGTKVPVWILGSSTYGAQMAAHYGLPYAFASHFAPAELSNASKIYRRSFRPSKYLEKSHFMLAANVFAANTDEEGAYLRTSMQQAFINLRTGRPGPLPAPVADLEALVGPVAIKMVEDALRISAVGAPETVKAKLLELIATYEPDELIFTGQIHDHQSRKRSFEIAAKVMEQINGERQAAE